MTGNPLRPDAAGVMSDAPAEPAAIRSRRTRGAAVMALLIVGTLPMVGAGIGI